MSADNRLEKMKSKTILVLGDVMVDAYFSGRVDRISPEAPVPIVLVENRDNRLGGAANVALNIKALGATPIVCSIVGDDDKGKQFLQLLSDAGLTTEGIVRSSQRPTTVKTRIISDNQQILRVDEESIQDLDSSEQEQILDTFTSILAEHNIDAVIFQDYNKGLLTQEVIKTTIATCQSKGILTAVDPKKENFFSFKNCDLFKPNLKEVREGLKQDIHEINVGALKDVAEDLRKKLNHRYTLLTLSEHGVFFDDKTEAKMIAAHPRDIKDVSGAGDTVISVVTLFLLVGSTMGEAAEYANIAGGLVCEAVGVVPIDKDKLRHEAQLTGLK